MSQDEGVSESPVEILEKAEYLGLIWTGGITSLSHLERHTESNASKGDDALLSLKMDRNLKIFLETRKGCFVSHLTSRSVCIILSSLV